MVGAKPEGAKSAPVKPQSLGTSSGGQEQDSDFDPRLSPRQQARRPRLLVVAADEQVRNAVFEYFVFVPSEATFTLTTKNLRVSVESLT